MLEVKGLRTEFIRYLEEEGGPAEEVPAVTAKKALFAYYHDIGMPFEGILKDAASMAKAEVLLTEHFGKVRHKEPEKEAAAYRACWEKFRSFLEATDRLVQLEAEEPRGGEH